MKLGSVSLPHPAIGIRGHNNPNSDENDVRGLFEVSQCLVKMDSLEFSVSVSYKLVGSPQLQRLIDAGKVCYACEFACSKTAYREIFKGGADLSFSVNINALRDQVVLSHYLVSQKPFTYADEDCWHPDYKGFSFHVRQGAVMGYAGESRHMIERETRGDTSGSSLFAVECGVEETGPFEVDINSESLTIFLPKKVYCHFSNVYENRPELAVHFHSSLAVPSLMHALAVMASESKDFHQDKRWYQAIQTAIQNDKTLRESELTSDNTLKFAQHLLQLPFMELMQVIMSSVETQSED